MKPIKLIVVAKEPLPGRVKTRLCPPFTPAQAAALATAAIADTLRAVLSAVVSARAQGFSVEPVLALDGSPGPWLARVCASPRDLRVISQREGGLDQRLAGAFDDATAQAPESWALLVGMDTPQITADLLVDAIKALASPGTDAVLGLAEDGGWWGLGLRRADPRLLIGVPMSTPHTGREQYLRLRSAQLSVGLLPLLRDVDTAEDAAFVAAKAPHTRFAAALLAASPALPATSHALPAAS